ncbi:MAG TPA: hypothetical protein VFJ43_17535 [Bacteroidia bacterium]|nr:hypothetical protein [Bacteroidia bacterium]
MRHFNSEQKIIPALLLFLFSGMSLAAQYDVFPDDTANNSSHHILISKDVDTTGKISKFGPNRLFYLTPFLQIGEMPGPQVYGSQTNWWSSCFAYGIRSKLKIFYWNALVLDIDYRYDRFSINQKRPKLPPLITMSHERERISLHNFSGSLCDRINFRKRGNIIGSFIEFGVYGDYVLRSTDVFVDRHYDSNSASGYSYKTKTTLARLPYIDKMNYGLTVRLGSEGFALFANYRINSLFNYDSLNNRDLPKLTIGIDLSSFYQ